MKIIEDLFRTFVLFVLIIFVESGFTQEYPQSIYPLQLGNIWVTRDGFGRPYERIEVIDSGIVINQKSYFKSWHISYEFSWGFQDGYFYQTQTDGHYSVWYDSTGTYVDPEVKYYKIKSQPGDYWQNTIGPPGYGTRYYFVVDTSYYLIFGISTKVREINVTDSSLYQNYTFWSEEFGLLEHYIHDFELGNYIYLWGCVIDGVLYGDTTFLTVGIDDIQNAPITVYKLYQNYPNPFNPATTIDYELQEYSYVKLKVYDILGNEVAVLVEEEKYAGKHKIKFDGKNLTSGVYFYKLTIGGNTQVRKMILLQ